MTQNKRTMLVLPVLLALALLAGACGDDAEEEEGLPNPASVYCEEQGGSLEIRTDAEGNQYGVCRFDDGSECDEWDFYHGDCRPGDSAPGQAGLPNPASAYCEEQGGRVDIRTDADGNQYGVCIFDDGSECDEWDFYRGECSPGGDAAGDGALGDVGLANPASAYCLEVGGVSENRTDADGNQYGVCVFPDGTEQDEWDLYRARVADDG